MKVGDGVTHYSALAYLASGTATTPTAWADLDLSISDLSDLTTRNQHVAIDIAILSGAGKKISSVLVCRLFRDGANVLDTLDSGVYLTEFDFHLELNTVGSRNEWTKA